MNVRLLLICFIFLSCSAGRMTETSLYFGQSKPDGSIINEKEWNQFKEDYILTTFLEGSSIIRVDGSWKDTVTHKVITEPVYMVIYYYRSTPLMSKRIDSLRNQYIKRFQQQSVLRVDKRVKASF
ncbi:MAG: DUF3574 domain-containing protein [Ilyomonas sp.]